MSFEGSDRKCPVHAQTRLEASTSRVGALFGFGRDRRLFLFIVIIFCLTWFMYWLSCEPRSMPRILFVCGRRQEVLYLCR